MSRPKSLGYYPPQFAGLYAKALGEEVRIRCGSPTEAASMRSRLYAFRTAATRDVAEREKMGISLYDLQQVLITLDGPDLVMQNRQNDPMVRLIESQVKLDTRTPREREAEQVLESLRQKGIAVPEATEAPPNPYYTREETNGE